MSRGRTIAFIDNSNVFHGQKTAGWRVDAKKLHNRLERDGEIWQTFFFASVTDPPRYEQTNFYSFIKDQMRYEVQLFRLGRKTLRCGKCGKTWTSYAEKGVDVALATRLLTLANDRAFDTAILVAADRDFLETVRAVKNKGLRVEIVAWRGTISRDMEAASSAPVVYLNDIRGDVELTVAHDVEAEKLTRPDEDDEEDQDESEEEVEIASATSDDEESDA
jgi:uncharacterized LabA/DUF88 family protein